jgi:hypothetical protein
MMIKASGRSALILATGLFVCFAAPSPTKAAGADGTAVASRSENAISVKSAKQSSRHWKRSAHRKSGKIATTSSEINKPKDTDVADAERSTPYSALPTWVANANAQLASTEASSDNASAMTAKANTMLLAAADKPADTQPTAEADVVASDQLNDIDRALQQSQSLPAKQTVAMASDKAAATAPVLAGSSESSTWEETSLIGKIFIAFGALLTMASAARMFMA